VNCARVRPRLGDHLEGDLDLATRARVDQHLSDCASCTSELRELRSIVAHIRSLPTPTPPPNLANAVMRRIEAGEGRTQRFPVAIRRLLDPVWVAPLAAGIAGLALLADVEIELVGSPETVVAAPRDMQIATRKEIEMWTAQPPTLARKEIVRPRLTAIERSAAHRFYRPDRDAVVAGFYGRLDPDSQQLDLDDQLDRAKLDPATFLRRLDAITELERSSMVAPLVVRSTRRGDTQVVAQRLRGTSHPLASAISAQFDQQRRQEPAGTPRAIPVSTR
jgi:hypothetical protein